MEPKRIDFVGNRRWFYLFSLVLLLPGTISLLIPPRLKLGIDFSSGSTFSVRFEQPVTRDQLKDELESLGHSEARVQGTGNNQFLVRTEELQGAASQPAVGPAPPSERTELENGLRERFGNMTDSTGKASPTQGFVEFSSISASLSSEIARNATLAVLASAVAIFFYLWWSFRAVPQPFRMGGAAIIALLHDALFVLGAFSILGKLIDTEVNSYFITAMLTVIGFSVHDSIVVFDRVRETVSRGEERTFSEAVNSSLLQTLGRSLNTTLTLIFSILCLLLIGGSSIKEFLWAMLLGTVTGAYSSVFIASQILVSWDEGDVPRLFRRIFRRPEPAKKLEPLTTVEA
jgi:preprotein translocase subunit SecF